MTALVGLEGGASLVSLSRDKVDDRVQFGFPAPAPAGLSGALPGLARCVALATGDPGRIGVLWKATALARIWVRYARDDS